MSFGACPTVNERFEYGCVRSTREQFKRFATDSGANDAADPRF